MTILVNDELVLRESIFSVSTNRIVASTLTCEISPRWCQTYSMGEILLILRAVKRA